MISKKCTPQIPVLFLTKSGHHFSWQAMAGLAFPIFRNTEISLEYKFHEGGSHFYNHTFGVGLVYNFGFSRN